MLLVHTVQVCGEKQGINVIKEREKNHDESRMPGHQTKTHHHHTDERQCGFIFVLEMLQLPTSAVLERKNAERWESAYYYSSSKLRLEQYLLIQSL